MKKIIALALVLASFQVHAWGGRQYNRTINIINLSHAAITAVHASNVGMSVYGPDTLGRDILYPGDVEILNLDDGTDHCLYDLKIITTQGTIFRDGLDACSITNYTIYD